MKALILSDVHANMYALEAIWAKERDCDLILCCGDVVDYGLYPREVLAWLREHNVKCVQGNHDAWVSLNYRRGNTLETVAPEERLWAHYAAGLLDEADVEYLENLPRAIAVEMDGMIYGMTHLYREYNEIVSLHAYSEFTAELFPQTTPGTIKRLLMGHTHRQAVRYLADDVLWANPGSASYRRHDDPDQAAHYATITDGKISLRRVEYDVTPLYRAVKSVQLKQSELDVANFFFGPR